jgi:hypothetical protein
MQKLEFEKKHKAIFRGCNDIAIGQANITSDGAIFFKKPSLFGNSIPTRLVLSRDNKHLFDDYDLIESNGEKIRLYNFSILDGKPYSIAGDTERRLRAENEELTITNQYLINAIENKIRELESKGIPDIGLRDAIAKVEAHKKMNTYSNYNNNNNSGGGK